MSGPETLEQLTESLLQLPEKEDAVPELFQFMERLRDVDLGTPGPLVYTLEQLDYADELLTSAQRCPTPLSVWMLSRLLRREPSGDRRRFVLDLLSKVPNHPLATYGTREDAKHLHRLHAAQK